jgi:signal transduction histidine kinase
VAITDTGEGIAPEDLPLIFDRFHKRHSSGRGLGLAIVRSIVRAHGGEVGVESQPGKGSTFWLQLPIA